MIDTMDSTEEKETLAQLFHRTITLLKNYQSITRYQLELRLAIDKVRADKIYNKLRDKEVISEEQWHDKPTGRMIIGILDKKRLKEVREELLKPQ